MKSVIGIRFSKRKGCPASRRFLKIGSVILLTGVNEILPVISTLLGLVR
jgi:hypothetical protein